MGFLSQQVKLVCSYGGKLRSCPVSKKLVYHGGDTRLIIVDRSIEFQDLIGILSSSCRLSNGGGICVGLKYQLPGEEDLNAFMSLMNDEDLENMMFEYDRIRRNLFSVDSVKIRLFLDIEKPKLSGLNPDYLFGFDKEEDYRKIIDEKAFEEWTIPREQHSPKSESKDQPHVVAQLQNLISTPDMFYYPPAPAYGWEMVPAYILVAPPAYVFVL